MSSRGRAALPMLRKKPRPATDRGFRLVRLPGIEPGTSELSALRSNRLSYSRWKPLLRCNAQRLARLPDPVHAAIPGSTLNYSFSANVTSMPPTRSAHTL